MKKLIKEIKPYVKLYRDEKSGIAWIENGSTGCGHSCHANIDTSGSVRGMKNLGYWKKDARTVRSHGFIYNIDSFCCSDEYDNIAAEYCACTACLERKSKPEPYPEMCKYSENGICTNCDVACGKCDGGEFDMRSCTPFQLSVMRHGENWAVPTKVKDDYIYSCEWRYENSPKRNSSFCIIVKTLRKECGDDIATEIEQVNSRRGYFFSYFDTLKEAVAHSIVKVEYIEFRDVPEEEIEAIKANCEE